MRSAPVDAGASSKHGHLKGNISPLSRSVRKTDARTLKAAIDLRILVAETHEITRSKVLCPFHREHTPSCHIYRDHFNCFGCGARGDHVDWLEHVHNLTTRDAIEELARRAGVLPHSNGGGARSEGSYMIVTSGDTEAMRRTCSGSR